MNNALHLGLDPAVAVQCPVDATGDQGFVVEPCDGGAQGALGGQGGLCLTTCSQQPVSPGYIDFAIEHDAGAVTRSNVLGVARVVEHLSHGGGQTAGHDFDGLSHGGLSGGHPAPEDAATLAGVGR